MCFGYFEMGRKSVLIISKWVLSVLWSFRNGFLVSFGLFEMGFECVLVISKWVMSEFWSFRNGF